MIEQFLIEYYTNETGKCPFLIWFNKLDKTEQVLIMTRINRMRDGNFGDSEPIKNGISELRLHVGPGFRIYYSKLKNKIILILIAGTKKSQTKDIEKATEYWKEYKEK